MSEENQGAIEGLETITDIPGGELPESVGPETQPPKKRRGRPPKNSALEEQSTASGEAKPKRAYTKKSERVTFDSDSTRKLAKQLEGIHLMVASITKLNEICISDTEAMMLAGSLQTMSAEYNLSLDGKTGAAIQLIATAAMIYVPRAIVINNKIKHAQNARGLSVVKHDDINAG